MLMNFLSHLLALDIAWFAELFAANWFFLFAFLALTFYFSPKRWFAFFIVFVLLVWGWMDVSTITGWSFIVAGFLLLSYLKTLTVVSVTDNAKLPLNHIALVSELTYITLFVWYGIFVIGGG